VFQSGFLAFLAKNIVGSIGKQGNQPSRKLTKQGKVGGAKHGLNDSHHTGVITTFADDMQARLT
jgi:hypothetical protein